MSFGKMNKIIQICIHEQTRDREGFTTGLDRVLATTRAYMEERHGNEKWANRAVFSTATALFRFRTIPGLPLTTSMCIVNAGDKYQIVSVEDVRGRGMYVEVLAEKIEGSVG